MLYYYIEKDINHTYDNDERKMVYCEFEDYPEHRHSSWGCVYVMELIPEYKYKNTRYLIDSKVYFDRIELDRKEIITVSGHKYIKEFEQKYNTSVWKEWCENNKTKERSK